MEVLGTLGSLLLLGFLILVVVCLAYLIPFLISSRPRRPKQPGFAYIYVKDDGSARELNDDEIDYLSAEFDGGDGGRPYIKSNYGTLTPDGKMRGYLRRRQLPKSILIEPAPPDVQ
jgi:hypothetical protein